MRLVISSILNKSKSTFATAELDGIIIIQLITATKETGCRGEKTKKLRAEVMTATTGPAVQVTDFQSV